MNRFPDWPDRLQRTIKQNRDKPFDWGTFDCALFACNVVHDLTGVDFAESFRDSYSDKRGAAMALKAFAPGGLVGTIEKIAEAHGCPEVSIKRARRGDVVLCDQDGMKALGICLGATFAAAGPDGLTFQNMTRAERAWSVGWSD